MHFPARRVHAEPAEPQHLIGTRVPVATALAQHRLHPGSDLPRAERLGDIVVGAHSQADELVHLLRAGGDEDDVDVGLGAQPPQRLDTVDASSMASRITRSGGSDRSRANALSPSAASATTKPSDSR